jgi:hypothetical protein
MTLHEPTKRKKIILPIEPYNELEMLENSHPFICSEITKKLSGYKSQDKKHGFCGTDLPTMDTVRQLILNSMLICFYCKNKMKIIYENVKDPAQWTLERIDNKFGHTETNLVIACLSCNLRRRTIYHERYVYTKQFAQNVVKEYHL